MNAAGPGMMRIMRVAACVAAAFLLVPMAMTLLVAMEADVFAGPGGGLTAGWLARALVLCLPGIGLSVFLAVATLVVTVLAGVPCAWALARLDDRFHRSLEQLLFMPLAVPGLTLALALVRTYSGWEAFRESVFFILCGHVLVTLPLMIGAVSAVLRTIAIREMEEGAATLGASFLRRFRDVVLPACAPGLRAGGLQVVTVSFGEFNLTWLLHTPMHPTVPTMLADAYATQRLELASACTVLFIGLLLPILLLVHRLNPHRASTMGPA